MSEDLSFFSLGYIPNEPEDRKGEKVKKVPVSLSQFRSHSKSDMPEDEFYVCFFPSFPII